MFFLERGEGQKGMVGEVMRQWTTSPPDLCLVSKEGHTVFTQKILLSLHSPLMGSLLSSCPPDPRNLPTISLPLSSTSLLNLLSILATGSSNSEGRFDLMELVKAAEILGVVMEDLQVAASEQEEGEEKSVKFQIADVSKPLVLVSAICELGNRVIFGKGGGVEQNLKTGYETPFVRKNGIYVLEMWFLDEPTTPFRRLP